MTKVDSDAAPTLTHHGYKLLLTVEKHFMYAPIAFSYTMPRPMPDHNKIGVSIENIPVMNILPDNVLMQYRRRGHGIKSRQKAFAYNVILADGIGTTPLEPHQLMHKSGKPSHSGRDFGLRIEFEIACEKTGSPDLYTRLVVLPKKIGTSSVKMCKVSWY